MPTINEEIDETWKRVAEESGIQLSPIRTDMAAFLDEAAQESASIGRATLEPWVSILETGILWLGNLYIALENAVFQHPYPSDQLRVAWVLTGFVCSEAVAIHRLSLSGLDPAAKGSLRSLIEALHVLTVCLADEGLSHRFFKAQTFEEARQLWFLELSPKKLNLRLDSIIQQSFRADDEVSSAVREWVRGELEVTSQFVHVSSIAAVMASRLNHFDGRTAQLAIFGASTTFSMRTLYTAASMIWFFSLIAFPLLTRRQPLSSGRIYRLNRNDENDQIVVLAYQVYDKLVRDRWMNSGAPAPKEQGEAS